MRTKALSNHCYSYLGFKIKHTHQKNGPFSVHGSISLIYNQWKSVDFLHQRFQGEK